MEDNSSQIGPFDFLTDKRRRAISMAVDAANRQHVAILNGQEHIYDKMNALCKTLETRGWLVAHVMETLSDDDGAKRRIINNIDGIEFDNRYFIHFKKKGEPGILPKEPKTLARARDEKQQQLSGAASFRETQLALFDLPSEEDIEDITPLSDLIHIVAEYVPDESGRIVALRLLDINYELDEILNSLDVDLTIPLRHQDSARPPATQFVVRPSAEAKTKEDRAL